MIIQFFEAIPRVIGVAFLMTVINLRLPGMGGWERWLVWSLLLGIFSFAEIARGLYCRVAYLKNVDFVTNDQTLGQVADKILVTGYQGFPCLNPDGSLCGVVTHKDVRDALSRGSDRETSIIEVETKDHLIISYPDETLQMALEKMAEFDLGHMPVVDPADPTRVVGFLTRKDIIMVYKAKAKERKDG